jgi:hypothetical protein
MVQFTRREYRLIRAVEPCLYHQRKGLYDDLNVRQIRSVYCETIMALVLLIQVLLLCVTFAWLFSTMHVLPEMSIIFATFGGFALTWLPQNIYNVLVCRAHYRHKRHRGRHP